MLLVVSAQLAVQAPSVLDMVVERQGRLLGTLRYYQASGRVWSFNPTQTHNSHQRETVYLFLTTSLRRSFCLLREHVHNLIMAIVELFR